MVSHAAQEARHGVDGTHAHLVRIDAIRPYFNDPAIRKAISPVQIEHRRAV
jgi:hypothetical protein